MSTPNHNADQFKLIIAKYSKLRQDAPRIVGNIAVNFFRASFRNQGQKINGSIKYWKGRDASPQNRMGAGNLLINTGRLRRGIIVKSATPGKVVIGVDAIVAPYAKIQNDGGEIPITAQMRKFFWAMAYKSYGGLTHSVATKSLEQTDSNRKLSEDANFWMSLAISKKKTLTIKARPFIYDSPDLANDITKDLEKRLKKILGQ